MKSIFSIFALIFISNSFAQKNMDTIYGNPKTVKEEITFLEKTVPKRLTKYQNNIFRNTSRYKSAVLRNFYRKIDISYVNCKIYFNKNGFKAKEYWFDFTNELESTYYYSYNKNKNLIEEKQVFWDDEFWLTKRHYNHLNKLIVRSYYYSEEPNKFAHLYILRDSIGNKIEYRSVDESGINNVTIHELNNQGKVIREYRKPTENFLHKNNNLSQEFDNETNLHKYRFDNNGNKIFQLNYYGSTNRVYSKLKWNFDAQNKLIEQKRFGNIKDTFNYTLVKYKYNKKGFITLEEVTNTKKGRVSSIETIYNHEGYIISSIIFENQKRIKTDYTYKFDSKRNWTKITKIVNGEPLYVWTRKIKYY